MPLPKTFRPLSAQPPQANMVRVSPPLALTGRPAKLLLEREITLCASPSTTRSRLALPHGKTSVRLSRGSALIPFSLLTTVEWAAQTGHSLRSSTVLPASSLSQTMTAIIGFPRKVPDNPPESIIRRSVEAHSRHPHPQCTRTRTRFITVHRTL